MDSETNASGPPYTLNELFPKYRACIAGMWDYKPELMENLRRMNFGPNVIRHILYHGRQTIVWLIAPDDDMRFADEAEIMALRRRKMGGEA